MELAAVDDQRQLRVAHTELRQQAVGLGGAGFEPFVRLRYPRQEVAEIVVRGLQPATDYLDGGAHGAHAADPLMTMTERADTRQAYVIAYAAQDDHRTRRTIRRKPRPRVARGDG